MPIRSFDRNKKCVNCFRVGIDYKSWQLCARCYVHKSKFGTNWIPKEVSNECQMCSTIPPEITIGYVKATAHYTMNGVLKTEINRMAVCRKHKTFFYHNQSTWQCKHDMCFKAVIPKTLYCNDHAEKSCQKVLVQNVESIELETPDYHTATHVITKECC